MFSALKKLTHRSPDVTNGSVNTPPGNSGVNAMNTTLQKKFARGVNYNLKLIIKGDRNTGKSCLMKRLQGGEFSEEYIPTDEIQVASIQWNYKATDDIVKVEVWDVVDKAKKRKKLDGLKLGTLTSVAEIEESLQPALDAEFVDVYKGTHGVVIVFDVTKLWTFEYVEKELAKVPAHIPVLVMANFIDKGHHRVVTREQASSFVELFDRGPAPVGKDPAEIRYAESSMRNGFGLKFLHKFLNLPYLILQRESLLLQLEINKREIGATQEELDAFQESPDGQYEHFLNGLTQRRRNVAESLAPPPTVDVVVGQPSNTFKELATPPKSKEPSPQPLPTVPSNSSLSTTVSSKQSTPRQNGTSQADKKSLTPPKDLTPQLPPTKSPSNSKLGKLDVDNFVPDQSAIDNFLEDDIETSTQVNNQDDSDDEESESAINPMVCGFADELDLDDFKPVIAVRNPDKSSSDEEIHESRSNDLSKKDNPESKNRKPKVAKNLFQVPNLSIQPLETVQVSDSEEDKKKKTKKKKSKKRTSKSPSRERDDLEDFLNGSLESGQPPDATVYEAL